MNYCKFIETVGNFYTGGSQLFHYHHHHHIIRHELGLHRLVSASFNSLFKGLRVVYVHLVYNSGLFLATCYCSFLLHVVANFICIFLVSRQLVLLSTLPKFLHSFCGQ